MFEKFTKKNKCTNLEMAINSVLKQMETVSPESQEYTQMAINLERLHSMKSKDKLRLSPDTILIVAGSLVGTVLVLWFEKSGVITSKAVSWLVRGRV
jgi:hypothetical protein